MFSCFRSERAGRRAKQRGPKDDADCRLQSSNGALLVRGSRGAVSPTGVSFFITGNSFPLICIKAPQGFGLEEYVLMCKALAKHNIFFQSSLLAFYELQEVPNPLPGPLVLEVALPPASRLHGHAAGSASLPSSIRMQYTLHTLHPEAGASSSCVPALHIEHLPSAAAAAAAGMLPKKSLSESDVGPAPGLAVSPPHPYEISTPFQVLPQQIQLHEQMSSLQGYDCQEPKLVTGIAQASPLQCPTQRHITWKRQRSQLMQSEVPVLLTLLSQDGEVLEQNRNSFLYHGNVLGGKAWDLGSDARLGDNPNPTRSGMLERLFVLAPDMLSDVLEYLLDPSMGPWKGIVQVPAKATNPHSSQASASDQIGPNTARDGLARQPAARARPPHQDAVPNQGSSAFELNNARPQLPTPSASVPPSASTPSLRVHRPPQMSKSSTILQMNSPFAGQNRRVSAPLNPCTCSTHSAEHTTCQSCVAMLPVSKNMQNSRLVTQIAAKMASSSREGSNDLHQAWNDGRTSSCLSPMDSHGINHRSPFDSASKEAGVLNRPFPMSPEQSQHLMSFSSCIDKYTAYRDFRDSSAVSSTRARSRSRAETSMLNSYEMFEWNAPPQRAGGDGAYDASVAHLASNPAVGPSAKSLQRPKLRRASSFCGPQPPTTFRNGGKVSFSGCQQVVAEEILFQMETDTPQKHSATYDQGMMLSSKPSPCKSLEQDLTSLDHAGMEVSASCRGASSSSRMHIGEVHSSKEPAFREKKKEKGHIVVAADEGSLAEAKEPAYLLRGDEHMPTVVGRIGRRSAESGSRFGIGAAPHSQHEHPESEEESYSQFRRSFQSRSRKSRRTARASASFARSSGDDGAFEPLIDVPLVYHEVEIKRVTDPVTERPAFLLIQRDASEQIMLENLLSDLTEDQLAMLSQIFPRHIIQALSTDGAVTLDNIADLTCSHSDVTILFLDIVSFTSTCGKESVTPESVIMFLNLLFSCFDGLVNKYHVQKIDTIGDAYLVASGILAPDEDGFWALDREHDGRKGAGRMVALAVDMMRAALEVHMPDGSPVRLRIGIHTGACVSGLVGLDVPKWSIFGDTVNTAARLEQTSPSGCFQLSEATLRLLPGIDIGLVPSGGVDMKGKGRMETWLWHPPDDWAHRDPTQGLPRLPHEVEALHQMCSPIPSRSKAFQEPSHALIQGLQGDGDVTPTRSKPVLLSKISSKGSEDKSRQDGLGSNASLPAISGSHAADGLHACQGDPVFEDPSFEAAPHSTHALVPGGDMCDAIDSSSQTSHCLDVSKSLSMPAASHQVDAAWNSSSLNTTGGLWSPKLTINPSFRPMPLFTHCTSMCKRQSSTTRASGRTSFTSGIQPLTPPAQHSKPPTRYSMPGTCHVAYCQQGGTQECPDTSKMVALPPLGTVSKPEEQPPLGAVSKPEEQPPLGAVSKPEEQPLLGTVSKPEEQPPLGTLPKPVEQPLLGTVSKPEEQPSLGTVPKPEEQPHLGTVPKPEEHAQAMRSAAAGAAGTVGLSASCRNSSSSSSSSSILDLPHTASCSLLFEDIAASPSSRLAELSIAEEGPTTFVLSSTALQSRPSTLQRRSTWNHQARDSAHAAHSPGSARPVLRQSTATQTSSLTVSSRLCGSVHDGKQESNVLSKSLPNSHDNTLSKGSAAQLAAKLASKHSSFKASSAVLSKPVLLRPQDRSVSTSGSKDSGGNHSGSDSLDKRGTLTNTAAVSGIIKASGTLARAQAHLGAAQLSHGSNHSSSHGGHGVRAHAGFAQPDKRSLFKPSGRRIQTH